MSSDVGGGKMQWYAFHNEPPGGDDGPHGMFFSYTCDLIAPECLASGEVKFTV